MALVQLGGQSLPWPPLPLNRYNVGVNGQPNVISLTLNASSMKIAMIGHVHTQDRATHTLSSSGGKIGTRFGTNVFTSSVLKASIQGVANAGPPIRPNGTDVVSGVLLSATGNAFNAFVMDTGSAELAHGDLVAIVFEMVTRAGSDMIQIQTIGLPSATDIPVVMRGTSSYAAQAAAPNVVIEFDDGTLGTLQGALVANSISAVAFHANSSPAEYGLIFRVPFACKVDALGGWFGSSGTSDQTGELRLYSEPLGAPVLMEAINIQARHEAAVDDIARQTRRGLSSEHALAPDTDYCVALAPGQSSTFYRWWLPIFSLADQSHRAITLGGLMIRQGTRSGESGPFTETPTSIPMLNIFISALDDGVGGGGGGAGAPFSRIRLGM